MSAAEELKALDKRMRNVRTRRIVTTAAGHDLFVTVSDALPQIVAVVEAAQGTGWPVPDRKRLDAALAALDKALT